MQTPADVVRSYLEAWADRDVPRAKGFLAPGFTMVYPGDRDYPTGNARGLNRIVLHEGRWRSERGDG